jgi:magnesium transporter
MLTIYKRICEIPPRGRKPFSRSEPVVTGVTESVGGAADVDDTAVWLDLLEPTRDEELALEERLGLALPTQEDMVEIESSSRLYLYKGAAFMTAQVAFFGGLDHLQSGPVTFVLSKERLITIRYIQPTSFRLFADHIERQPHVCLSGTGTFLGLLDVLVDRTADLIEKTSDDVDALSKTIFQARRTKRLENVLSELGGLQNDIARIRDSLLSLTRLSVFAAGLERDVTGLKGEEDREYDERLRTTAQDLVSLSDHATYVTGNITFLLDAALGFINLEQNNIVRLISITSVIFLPLTLIASIYGMNFDAMPGLHSPPAFWVVVAIMVVIAGSLLWWFKQRQWL